MITANIIKMLKFVNKLFGSSSKNKLKSYYKIIEGINELEKEISNFISTEIEWVPLNSVEVSKEKNDDLINFFELLEEEDDVQNIYSNAQFIK